MKNIDLVQFGDHQKLGFNEELGGIDKTPELQAIATNFGVSLTPAQHNRLLEVRPPVSDTKLIEFGLALVTLASQVGPHIYEGISFTVYTKEHRRTILDIIVSCDLTPSDFDLDDSPSAKLYHFPSDKRKG